MLYRGAHIFSSHANVRLPLALMRFFNQSINQPINERSCAVSTSHHGIDSVDAGEFAASLLEASLRG